MKAPPLLIGAALLFWGWQADFFITSAVLAVILESSRFIRMRWELTNEDFSRIWTFCAVLFLATGAYAFTASNGAASVGNWFTNGVVPTQTAIGSVSAKTAVLLIRLVPLAFFLFVAAQAYSDRGEIPLETISMILRRRIRQAKNSGQPAPASRNVDVAFPYLIACLFAASSHPTNANNTFFWGLCAILIWVFWSQRSRRFDLVVWAGTIGLAIVLGYGGQRGLMRLKLAIDQYNPEWLGKMGNQGFDPLESRTEIGQIGRIKTSSQIVIRLETTNKSSMPPYLREAGYRTYKNGVWYASNSKEDFTSVAEDPLNSEKWPLLPRKTNTDSVNIACYLSGGKGLLPLPASSGRLEQLPAFLIQKNSFGAVRAEGPGLVIFNAHYGPGGAIDLPPDTDDDLTVPDREKAALDRVASELHLTGLPQNQMQQTIAHHFGTKFTYSLWQEAPRIKDTNSTALSRFLLLTHSGHCEYFATATVLLLRELGIPARYNVGYAVHETSGNKSVVRQNDAHAWCRVWNAGNQSWEDFDTTPGIWMATEHEQRSSLQFISDAWSRMFFEFSKFRWGQSHLRQYILWLLAPVLALLLYQIVFRSGKRRKSQSSEAEAGNIIHPGLDSEFYQLENELKKRGLVRPANEPTSVWLRRIMVNTEFLGLNESLLPLIQLHYRYRFDPRGLDAQERNQLRRGVAACLSRIEAKH